MTRPTILLIGESVALAHASRPLALAKMLDLDRYDVHLAFDPRHQWLCDGIDGIQYHELQSITPDQFLTAPPGRAYLASDLSRYLEHDRKLLSHLRPDLVVSDFRYTAPTAAAVEGVRLASLVNAYWNPNRVLGFDPHPGPPSTIKSRLRTSVPGRAVRRAVRSLRPRPSPKRPDDVALLNDIRRGLHKPPLGGYLEMVTDGDYILHPEPPGLVSISGGTASTIFIGHVEWSPNEPLFSWPDSRFDGQPIVYLTVGSTGDVSSIRALIGEIAQLDVFVVVVTAGRFDFPVPANVMLVPIVPGSAMCSRASVVVCSGGSGTAYQAVAAATPLVGLYSNLDQFLTSQILARRGVGQSLASDTPPRDVAPVVRDVLEDRRYEQAASSLAELFGTCDPAVHFPRFVESVAGRAATEASS